MKDRVRMRKLVCTEDMLNAVFTHQLELYTQPRKYRLIHLYYRCINRIMFATPLWKPVDNWYRDRYSTACGIGMHPALWIDVKLYYSSVRETTTLGRLTVSEEQWKGLKDA